VSYAEIAKLAGAKPLPVMSRPEDDFIVNPDAVARAITPRTRMILIVSPCNPTGAVYDEKTLRALADLAVKHDICCLPTTSTAVSATAMPASCSRPPSAPRCASARSS